MYHEKDFSLLLGVDGFSDAMLSAHFKLYAGYVKNTNALLEKIKNYEKGSPEWNELTRRFGWEFNGMRLHELYFGNMTRETRSYSGNSALHKCVESSFGSKDKFLQSLSNFSSMRGIGWVIVYYDSVADAIFNVWVGEHGENHLSGCEPLLVMDMWEHAFISDYGLDKARYVDNFIKVVDWQVVEERFNRVNKKNLS